MGCGECYDTFMGVTRQSWGDITLHYTQANIVIKRDSRDPLFSELTIINVHRLNKTSYFNTVGNNILHFRSSSSWTLSVRPIGLPQQ